MDRPGRVALYAKVPTDDPDDRLQVETQFIILREHASDLGVDVQKDYADTGSITWDRPQLQEMMREAASPDRPFDSVLVFMVFNESLISRSMREYRELAGPPCRNSVKTAVLT